MLVRFSVVSYAITAALCSLLVVNTVHAATDIESQLAGMVDRLFAQAALTQPVTVAVLPFESQLGPDSKAGTGVAEFLVSVLTGRPGVTLVDRSSFSKVMGEIALSQSGAFDENQLLEAGKMLSADHILTGTIVSPLAPVVHARLIETQTGAVKASVSHPVSAEAFAPFVSEILGEKMNVGATVFRSAVVPGWGQMFAGAKGHGVVSLSLFLAAAAGTGTALGITGFRAKEYNDYTKESLTYSGERALIKEWFGEGINKDDPGFPDEQYDVLKKAREDSLWNRYQSALTVGLSLLGATGVVWVGNLVDAAIVARKMKSRVQLYFSAVPLQNRAVGVKVSLLIPQPYR